MKNIVMVLGHGQNYTRPNTGLHILSNKIYREHFQKRPAISLYNWDVNIDKLSARLSETAPIMLIGYSYGGSTINFLAHHLAKRNICVEYMMLIDPVWRKHLYRASLGSLDKNKKILLSDNVKTVYSWRQEYGKIRGHKVIVGSNTVHYEYILHNKHYQMDDNSEIHKTVTTIAGDFLRPEGWGII